MTFLDLERTIRKEKRMSFWSNLNPITALRKLLISNYAGSIIRHGLTVAATLLVAKGVISSEQGLAFVDAAVPLILGALSAALAAFSSAANKSEAPPPPGSKAAKLAQPVAHL